MASFAGILLALTLVTVAMIASTRLSSGLAVMVPLVLVAGVLLVVNPRLEISLAVVGLYVGVLDGYIKLSSGSQLATSGRDVLLYAVVAGALLRLSVSRRPVRVPKYTAHVVLLAGIVAVQALNPGTPGAKAALGGLRQHLEFVPLLFLGYATMRTEKRLHGFLVILIIIVVANSAVAVVQYGMTPHQLAAWGPGYAERVLGTGAFEGGGRVFVDSSGLTHVRPFGLGSDGGAAGVLGSLLIAGTLALLVVRRGLRPVVYGAVGVVSCVVGIASSQSRSAAIAAGVSVIVFAAISVTSRAATQGLVALLVAGLLVYGGVEAFLVHRPQNSPSRLSSLKASHLTQTVSESRGLSATLIPQYAANYPLGVGLGRAGPAAGFGGANSGLNAENEPNLLIGELGTIGLIVFATLWLRVLLDGVRAARRTVTATTRLYLAGLVAPLAALTLLWFASSPTTAPPAAPYFWFVAGVVAWAISAPTSFSESGPEHSARQPRRPA